MSSNRGLEQRWFSNFHTLKKIHNHGFDLPRACWHTVCTPMHLKTASQEAGRQLLAPLKRHQLIGFAMHQKCREGDLDVPAAAQLLGICLISGHEAAELRTQQTLQCALRAEALRNMSFWGLASQASPSLCSFIHWHRTAELHLQRHSLTIERLKG